MSEMSFIPGLELARRFYWEAVRPVLDDAHPDLPHSAALIGYGSEVLGFDTPMSTDHHWGPRAMIFLAPADYERYHEALHELFRWRLPHRFLGYPTNFSQPVPEDPGTRHLKATEDGPIDHRVEIFTVAGFMRDYLGHDPACPRPPRTGCHSRNSGCAPSPAERSTTTGWGWPRCGRASRITRTTCGCTCWPAVGSASDRRST